VASDRLLDSKNCTAAGLVVSCPVILGSQDEHGDSLGSVVLNVWNNRSEPYGTGLITISDEAVELHRIDDYEIQK